MTGTEETGSTTGDSKKETTETTLQATIDALQASAAALKDLTATPSPTVMGEGSGTAVVGQVAYRMLDLAAVTIVAAVPPTVRPLIVERTDLVRWKCEHEAVTLRIDALATLIKEQARACDAHLASAPSGPVSAGLVGIEEGSAEGGVPTKAMSFFSLSGVAGLANVATAGALAVGNVVRFLTPTLRVSARQTALDHGALVAAVAGRFAAEKRSVAALRWIPRGGALHVLRRLEAVRTGGNRLAVMAGVLEAAVEAKREDEAWRKTAASLAAGSRALLKETAASLGAIGETCGPGSPLAEAISWECAARSDATHYLCLELVQQGGDVVERIGPLGTRVLYLGGCTVVWVLVACGDATSRSEEKVLGAGIVPVMGSFSCDPSSPGDGTFRIVRMEGEATQFQEWLVGGSVLES